MTIYEQKIGIKHWAEEDRPREKLVLQGRRHLTDAELLAILIGSGNREETAVDLSKRLLLFYKNDLDQLGKASITELCKFKGIGEAKAVAIVAALELGRRRKESLPAEILKITGAKDAFDILSPILSDLPHEEFWMLILNRANHVKDKVLISRGGQSGTVVDTKIIFKNALDKNASYLILAHNHPSGNTKPSTEDLRLTRRISEAGKILDIPILDHIIIGDRSFFSFADEGLV
ncbi:RadC family protein [Pedobacter nutrimenti]|uniref:RadC family protein n=1 Tax=Pedobacter nutrimenti TaxID=1241337 RepID=UPI00292CF8E3|nr:DNA repair protein RadC [Pedobacter nutrimenti]